AYLWWPRTGSELRRARAALSVRGEAEPEAHREQPVLGARPVNAGHVAAQRGLDLAAAGGRVLARAVPREHPLQTGDARPREPGRRFQASLRWGCAGAGAAPDAGAMASIASNSPAEGARSRRPRRRIVRVCRGWVWAASPSRSSSTCTPRPQLAPRR